MHWIVQNNLYEERGYHTLLESLHSLGIQTTTVKITPIQHRLVSESFDSALHKGDISDIPEVVIDEQQPIMVCGSITLGEVAKQRGWQPGTFLNQNHTFEIWSKIYGNQCLNSNGSIVRFDQVRFKGSMFVRPVLDDKSFSGHVSTWRAFDEWKQRVLRYPDALAPVKPETLIVLATPQKLLEEHRFYVVDGRIVASSQYQFNRRLVVKQGCDPVSLAFAQEMIDTWQPAKAFVIDTVLVEQEGRVKPKIVELGCINSAGFYAADVKAIVEAIDGMDWNLESNFNLR